MPQPLPRFAVWLSWGVAALATPACLIGLLRRSVYRDPETFIDAGWMGNDLVTLVIAIPALAWSTTRAASSGRARLAWLGCLSFMLYNYAFYLFGAAPNRLLLAYIVIVALSLLGVIVGLLSLSPPEPWTATKPIRWFLLTYMSLWAVALAAIWVSQAAGFAFSGETPDLNGSPHAFRR